MSHDSNTNGFLPADYTAPSSSDLFMKFQDGDSNFRILSSALTGYEYWTEENKVIRSKVPFTETPNIKKDKGGKEQKPKHFWVFTVWNYNTKNVEILHISQKTIQTDILSLAKDEDWGDPRGYDIKVNRSGKDLTTKYQVSPKPKKPLTKEQEEAFAASDIDLVDLYFGDNGSKMTIDDIA